MTHELRNEAYNAKETEECLSWEAHKDDSVPTQGASETRKMKAWTEMLQMIYESLTSNPLSIHGSSMDCQWLMAVSETITGDYQ